MKYFILTIAFILILSGCAKKNESEIAIDPIEDSEQSQTDKEQVEKKEFAELYKKIKKIDTPDFTRGIYLTGYTIASEKFEIILDQAEQAGINTVIFDIKNMKGDVFLSGAQKDTVRAKKYKPIFNIAATVKALHGRNMKAVCRIVVFHDQLLAENFPELRPQHKDGGTWGESKRRKPSWLDSSNPEVQSEVQEIIERAASYGVDEIQMDYIRFPTQGDLENAVFNFQKIDNEKVLSDSNYIPREKIDIIETFIEATKKRVDKYGVTLTADIFAIVAWQSEKDIMNTGQDIAKLSEHLDSLHPMIYSSHFAADFGYRKDIYNEPYYILFEGTKRTIEKSADDCSIIPYIQANSWKVNYGKEYVIAQIRGIEDAGGSGFILWSSSNIYEKTLLWISEYYFK
jgi:hypothetical protein